MIADGIFKATTWYYNSLEKGMFLHQQKLCKAVEWTKYNIEGQYYSGNTLTAGCGNPLTIRLLAFKNAIDILINYTGELDSRIRAFTTEQLKTQKYSGMGGTFYGKDSLSNTSGAPIEIIRFDGISTELEFKYISVHLALYELFSNFGSVMDRLAYEIDLLHDLTIPKIDWPRFTDKKDKKAWESLNAKNNQLASLIKDYSPKFENAFRYRNRLVHEGLINFKVDFNYQGIRGLYIWLAQNPSDPKSPVDVNAIEFCKQTKANVLKLLDECYILMLQYFKSTRDA